MRFNYSLILVPIVFLAAFAIYITKTEEETFKRFEDLKEIDGIYFINNAPYSGEVRVYDKDNKILKKADLLNGILNGKYEEYYENGNISYTGKYISKKKKVFLLRIGRIIGFINHRGIKMDSKMVLNVNIEM